mmetsp:Transcript_82745/g.184671  ORF Transcript_82745/g.184671 Transcript_82745/m.184671 type:complete len:937 (+) Transcript_82745:82-2892(+)
MFAGLGSHDTPERRAANKRHQAALLAQQIAEDRAYKEAAREKEALILRREEERDLRWQQELQQELQPLPSGRRQRQQSPAPGGGFDTPQLQAQRALPAVSPPPAQSAAKRRARVAIDIDAEWEAWQSRNPQKNLPPPKNLQPGGVATGLGGAAGGDFAGADARPQQIRYFSSSPEPGPPPPLLPRYSPPEPLRSSPPRPSPGAAEALRAEGAVVAARRWGPSRTPSSVPGSPVSRAGPFLASPPAELRAVAASSLQDELQKLKTNCSEQRERLRVQAQGFRDEAARLLAERATVPSVPSRLGRVLTSYVLPAPPAPLQPRAVGDQRYVLSPPLSALPSPSPFSQPSLSARPLHRAQEAPAPGAPQVWPHLPRYRAASASPILSPMSSPAPLATRSPVLVAPRWSPQPPLQQLLAEGSGAAGLLAGPLASSLKGTLPEAFSKLVFPQQVSPKGLDIKGHILSGGSPKGGSRIGRDEVDGVLGDDTTIASITEGVESEMTVAGTTVAGTTVAGGAEGESIDFSRELEEDEKEEAEQRQQQQPSKEAEEEAYVAGGPLSDAGTGAAPGGDVEESHGEGMGVSAEDSPGEAATGGDLAELPGALDSAAGPALQADTVLSGSVAGSVFSMELGASLQYTQTDAGAFTATSLPAITGSGAATPDQEEKPFARVIDLGAALRSVAAANEVATEGGSPEAASVEEKAESQGEGEGTAVAVAEAGQRPSKSPREARRTQDVLFAALNPQAAGASRAGESPVLPPNLPSASKDAAPSAAPGGSGASSPRPPPLSSASSTPVAEAATGGVGGAGAAPAPDVAEKSPSRSGAGSPGPQSPEAAARSPSRAGAGSPKPSSPEAALRSPSRSGAGSPRPPEAAAQSPSRGQGSGPLPPDVALRPQAALVPGARGPMLAAAPEQVSSPVAIAGGRISEDMPPWPGDFSGMY